MSQQLLDEIKASAQSHPECKPGEILITNVFHQGDYCCIGWKTKRMGNVAYTVNGDRLPDGRPVFVQEEEILNSPY